MKKFLYGDEEEDLKQNLHKAPWGSESEIMRQKARPLPSSAPTVKLESMEETNPEYAKIHDLLKTIGLDIGVAELVNWLHAHRNDRWQKAVRFLC